ncbi:BREX-1 system adenine-specific DNA-methyltransferase PglX [Vibrio owensii]|uniref:BREX-1 system adenine-specific DNA-methyltransferase PglX n=1 Tax=Vibrio owensii TaxID=696485 RepID=UPI003D9FF7C5
MDTSRLKKFAQFARRSLIEQVQTKLKFVLAEDSLARRESPKAVKELENKKQELGEEQLLEQVAYTWFNRFCALRFMDANQYNRIMVVSPVAGQFQPEILAEAKAGHLDDGIFNEKARDEINGLLSGSIPSRDGQSEAYRLMIVAVCNDYHRLMPYLFERIEDYTELLMPDDLLSGNSILAYTREAMTPENCESVESIGWLYQFYISEKKDQVFEGLKKNKKITPENIPAATQLFTPRWIVRYLVENSLGRLWMLNNPNSKVIEQMDYYIKPVEEEKDYLKISSPEELKICDPACGSGHMLTYAYDLLYAIYLDAGYDDSVIPEKILSNNLYGIEIDERAAELAAFALSMKALKGNPLDESNNRRRFFRNPIEPNICHIQNVSLSDIELDEYFEFVGVDLFTRGLRATLKEFEEADNFGSLIQPTLKNPADVLAMLESKDVSGQLFLADTHKSVLQALKQADYLNSKYHVVIANPPYMGSGGMNERLSEWIKCNYPDSKADLFSVFIQRGLDLNVQHGVSALITMQSWMFLTSYEKLRATLISKKSIVSMAHLGPRAFDSIGGEVVSTSAFVIENSINNSRYGTYFNLTAGRSEKDKNEMLLAAVCDQKNERRYSFRNCNLKSLPGNPIAYWISNAVVSSYSNPLLSDYLLSDGSVKTGNNAKYLRMLWEVSRDQINPRNGWRLHPKGGEFRRWYGNVDTVVSWTEESRAHYKSDHIARILGEEYWDRKGISWSAIGNGGASFRILKNEYVANNAALCVFPKDGDVYPYLAFLNSVVFDTFVDINTQTVNYLVGDVQNVPYIQPSDEVRKEISDNCKQLIGYYRSDWDELETSLDYLKCPLVVNNDGMLSHSYERTVEIWQNRVKSVASIETDNNMRFIELYRLDELSPVVNEIRISLNCNSLYRYGDDKTQEQRELYLKRDAVLDLLSYSVGCMFGRYSLDSDGVILGNQGDTLDTYLTHIYQPSFLPDQDNVIPLIDFDGDWFADDIAERFKHFLKIAFGEEYFSENLGFIEEAIGKDIKKYFVKDFYTDHLKRYKKRPIYWMFSSPKGSFNALIYMHRYTKDTVDVVLNNYLREFRTKLVARKESLEQVEISASASQKDKTQAIKTIAKINKVLDEINDYEHDVLYPLAGEKVEIDLDDGVKHNYPLFGKALKKVPGLS